MIWIELHCDERRPGCKSNANENVMTGGPNSKAAINAALGKVFAEAHRFGWRKKQGRWICPRCLLKVAEEHITQSAENEAL